MSLGEEEAKRLGKSQVRLQESHDTRGRAGKVGVTARDVGHVGGVILGKGNHAPQGRETAGNRPLSQTVIPTCGLSSSAMLGDVAMVTTSKGS